LNNDLKNAPIVLTLYSNVEDRYAPEGKFVMVVMTLSGYDFWKKLSKEEYKKQKEIFADILIKKAEGVIPNFSSYIKVIETATPLTMERYTGNYKGAIYGWSQTVSQSGSNRLKNKTPIKNLYLAGAWTQPSGGIKGVMQSGIIVSNKILENSI
jgi:prolycopene isomerase